MRPKPLIPAFKAIRTPFRRRACPAESISGSPGRLLYVAVDHVDEEVTARGVYPRQMLGNHHRAVPAAGAADADREVGLALLLVLGQQVVEQRREVVVEVGDSLRALDVLDDRVVQPGQLAQ